MSEHPLKDHDPKDCYATMMTARGELVAAKRAAEEDLIKGLIQLSSAIVLIVPGVFLAGKDISVAPGTRWLLITGTLILLLSIVFCLLEQFLSARAYDRQIRGVTDFYTMKSRELPDDEHRLLKSMMLLGVVGFFAGVTFFAIFLISNL